MAIRDDFFTALAKGAKWDVGVSINRTNPLPLDANSVFKTKAELDTYAAGVLAYVGQPVAVVSENDTTLYVLDQNKVPQEVGKATLGDDKSISLDAKTGILKIVGFDSAEEGSQLVRTKDGVAWVKPDTSTAEGQATAIAALQTAVGSAAAGDKPATGLIKDVSDNAKAISDMDAAYKAADTTTLNSAKAHTDAEIAGLKVAIEKKEDVDYIVVKNKAGEEVTSVDASIFVQDSFLDDVSYDSETGKISFVWKMGDGSTKTDEVNVGDLVDTYTAGTGLNLSNNEFSVDTDVIATVDYVDGAIEDSAEALTTEINKKADSNTVTSEISRIETKIATDIAAAIKKALETDEGAQKYALDADLTALKGRVSTAEGTLADVDSKKHTHANKEELDKIESGDKEKWDAAAKAKHTHGNKSVLDSITSEKVAAWDAAKTDAETYTETYAATKAQGQLADSALQTVTILGHNLTKDNHTLSEETIKEDLGLGSAAYKDTTAFDAAGSAAAVQGDTTKTVKEAYDLAASKITADEVDDKIAAAGHASAEELTTHTSNSVIHVTKADKDLWSAAAAKVEELTGENLGGSGTASGGIASMITTAIAEHEVKADAKYATKTQTATDIAAAKKEVVDSLAETDVEVAENTAAIATLQEKDTAFETRIAALEGAKEDYKAADATLKSNLEGQIAAAEGNLTTAIATAKSEAIKDAKDYANELKATILGDNEKLKDTYDTLSEISEWIETHGADATDLATALAAETKAREDEDKAIDERLDALELYDHSAYIAADEVLKADLEGQITTAKSTLTAAIATAKSEAVTAAATDAATKVNTLRDGAVKTNTDNISTNTTNIATNTADIADLKEDKADKAESLEGYGIKDAYTKEEVDAMLEAAEIKWSTF